jgi:hypothetical protein
MGCPAEREVEDEHGNCFDKEHQAPEIAPAG